MASNHPITPEPAAQREFALEVVRCLREAGFEAYWAGGCVRDQLLGHTPKDYDVATSARPDEVRALFGRRRTLALGAAFGVITVLGPRAAGMIEVTTFREESAYSDGRHPDRVAFTSAAADAQRRDFTINGLFFDPLSDQVLDFVEGQRDLQRGVVRAIGQPHDRFVEDKLRMLRAVRFAAGFQFTLDPATAAAVRTMAGEITVVSPERIAQEMRRMLAGAGRAAAVRMLFDLRLAEAILPEIVPRDAAGEEALQRSLAALDRLSAPSFPLALGVLLCGMADAAATETLGRRWRLALKESQRAAWLVAQSAQLQGAASRPWSQVQPLLVHDGARDLVACAAAREAATAADLDFCRARLAEPRATLDPPPLLTGDDLRAGGLSPGPEFARLLAAVRAAQLDGEVRTPEEAWALVRRRLAC